MAEKLTRFDWTAPSRLTEGEKAVYPWDEWLDGDIWQLTQGEDFDPHPLMMERIIRTRATGKGAKVKLRHQPLNGEPFGILILQRSDIAGPAEQKLADRKAKREQAKAAKEAEAQAFVKEHNLTPVNGAKPSKRAPKAAPVPEAKPTKVASKVPTRRPVKKAALASV
jgi:hypothetical protein